MFHFPISTLLFFFLFYFLPSVSLSVCLSEVCQLRVVDTVFVVIFQQVFDNSQSRGFPSTNNIAQATAKAPQAESFMKRMLGK